MNKPLCALTMGDPAGIGPEVALKTLFSQRARDCARMMAIGYPGPFMRDAALLGLDIAIREIGSPGDIAVGEDSSVWMAGYFGSHVSQRLGGKLHVVAYCTDPDDDIARVELCYDGEPLVPLNDDGQSQDGLAGDGVYGCFVDVEPGYPAGCYLLEVVATDAEGNTSNVWPYVTIDDYPRFDLPGLAGVSSAAVSNSEVMPVGGKPASNLSLNLQNYILDSIRGVTSRDVGPEPEILMAGYGNCKIDQNTGGTLFLNVIVNDPDGLSNIASVEAHRSLQDHGDFSFGGVELSRLTADGQRGYYGANCHIAGGERGHHLIEVQVADKDGNYSTFFPYLVVTQ